MRILYFGNNWLGCEVLQWLKEQREQVIGLGIHPPDTQKYGADILRVAGLPTDKVIYGSQLRQPEAMTSISGFKPDIGISVLFNYVFTHELLSLFPQGIINLHPSLLPYHRGQDPNVWSIVEGTPAGVTLHYVDEGIDTGDIIAQKEVDIEPVDTGKSLYSKLEEASLELFKQAWPLIRTGRAQRSPQDRQSGTCHRTGDAEAIDEIDLDSTYRARDLINILRARTFSPYKGAYFRCDDKRIYMRLELEYGEEG